MHIESYITHMYEMHIYIAVTNQKVAEQNWHSNQKSEEQDIGSWSVEESTALVEDCFKIKLSS